MNISASRKRKKNILPNNLESHPHLEKKLRSDGEIHTELQNPYPTSKNTKTTPDHQTSIVMGVDPGSQVTGFAVVQIESQQKEGKIYPQRLRYINHGAIILNPRQDYNTRIQDLGKSFCKLLSSYQPDHVVVEKVFLGKNVNSALKLGQCRGVLIYESQKLGSSIYEYTTREVRKNITGRGQSDKREVAQVLCQILNLPAHPLFPTSSLLTPPLPSESSPPPKLKETRGGWDAFDALALAVHHSLQFKLSHWLSSHDIPSEELGR